MNELIPIGDDAARPDDAPSAMLGEIARQVEEMMLVDLKFVNGHLEPDGPGRVMLVNRDCQDVLAEMGAADLRTVGTDPPYSLIEPDDDPSEVEAVALSQYVTLPVLDDREPVAVPMAAPGPPTPVQFVGRPPRPVPPLFAPGGTPPGPAELRQALRACAEELIDHGRTLLGLSCRDEEVPAYVGRVLEYRSGDVSGVATKLGMLSRLFARPGVGSGPRGA